MDLNLQLEYYPRLSNGTLAKSINLLKNNKSKWDEPFFIDTKSHVNVDKIKQASEPFIRSELKNIIVLGTGGSIQTLSALKHLSKKNIYEITSSRAVELDHCLKATSPDDSIVIPISRGGETLDVNSTIGIFLKKGSSLKISPR